MSQSVVFNNTSYLIPNTGDVNWGDNVTSYLVAIAAGAFQLSGGSFFLTAEANFGPNFGLTSLYYKSRTANLASTGVLRLAKTDTLDWRNNANSGDLALGINGSDQLTFNGSAITVGGVTSITGTTNEVIASSSTGAVTLSTPQAIATTSDVTFHTLNATSEVSVGPSAGFVLIPNTSWLQFNDSGSLHTRIFGATINSGNYDLILPTAQGSNHTTLHNDGSGNTSFSLVSLATDVTGNLPVANLNGGSGAISTTYWAGNGVWSTPTGSGTVNAGTAGQVAYYPSSTTAVSGNPIVTVDSSSLRVTVNSAGVPADIVAASSTSAASRLVLQNSTTATWDYMWIGDGTSVRLRDVNNTQDVLTYTHGTNILSVTEPLAMGANKITGLAAASTSGDAVRYEQWHIASNVVYVSTSTKTTLGTSTADFSGLTASITPTLSTSKVLVRCCINISIAPTSGNSQNASVALTDGSNSILLLNNSFVGAGGGLLSGEEFQGTYCLEYLDTPGSTSTKTYKLRGGLSTGSVTQGTGAVNQDSAGGGANTTNSSITLQEIPA